MLAILAFLRKKPGDQQRLGYYPSVQLMSCFAYRDGRNHNPHLTLSASFILLGFVTDTAVNQGHPGRRVTQLSALQQTANNR